MLFLKPGPSSGAPTIVMSVAVALLVLTVWVLVLPALGAWRTRTRDA